MNNDELAGYLALNTFADLTGLSPEVKNFVGQVARLFNLDEKRTTTNFL
jgi:hypothetical protein